MNIVACYKLVPDLEEIAVKPDRTLYFDNTKWKIGQYDLNAVEAGLQIIENQAKGEMSVLTVGGDIVDNAKLRKGILARGADIMYGVIDESMDDADSYNTAAVLAAAVRKIGNVDLVLCGEGSADLYNQQVGIVLGCLLGYTTLNAVSKIVPVEDGLVVERNLEDSVEIAKISLPAVLSVTSDINRPRIPSMREILAANKKPVQVWSLNDIGFAAGNKTEVISTLAPEQVERKKIVFEGDSEDKINELYEHLRKIM